VILLFVTPAFYRLVELVCSAPVLYTQCSSVQRGVVRAVLTTAYGTAVSVLPTWHQWYERCDTGINVFHRQLASSNHVAKCSVSASHTF